MRAQVIIGFSVFSVSALAPMALFAGSPRPHVDNYAQFTLSRADMAAMPIDADKVCQATALATPNDLVPQVACNAAITTRLDARIKEATKWRLRSAPSQADRLVMRNQETWAANRQTVCEAKWAAELNPSSNSFGLAVSRCVAEETYRRALWLERSRR